jgi:hypothetical protein
VRDLDRPTALAALWSTGAVVAAGTVGSSGRAPFPDFVVRGRLGAAVRLVDALALSGALSVALAALRACPKRSVRRV